MLYRTLELTLAPALRTVYRPLVTGLHNLPDGPVVLAANHISFADEIFTPLAARRQVCYFAKVEYFNTPGLKGRAMAAFFNGMGHVPVARSDTARRRRSSTSGSTCWPRAERSASIPRAPAPPDGRLHRFRTGVARLALRSGAPVVPVGLVGTREAQPPGSHAWHLAPVEVHFGAPLYFGDRAGQERSSRVLREVTETVRAGVQALSGQEYVDAFAGSPAAAG